jgi:4-aminobutyrate---pyruvate transaminase
MGMIGAVELVADKTTHANFDPAAKVGGRLTKLCEANGVIARSLPGDVLAISPPLIMTKPEVDEMLDRMSTALDEVTVQLRREQISVVA